MSRRIAIWGVVAGVLLGGSIALFVLQPWRVKELHGTSSEVVVRPTLQITTSAADLTSVQGILRVTVSATGDKAISHVDYAIDGKFAGVSYNSPFSISLDVSGLSAGKHILTVTAYDTSNNASQAQTIDFTVVVPTTMTPVSPNNDTTAVSRASTISSAATTHVVGSTSSGSGSAPTSPSVSADTTPPSVPSNLIATDPGTFFVHLSWSASTDNVGVSGYQVWRNGTMIGATTGTSYDDHTSLPGGSYQYRVVAYDATGNTATTSTVSIGLANATVFNSGDTPPGDSGDGSSIELGMRFRATQDGQITGVRFYKSAANTGTHVGNLWTNNGTNLARVTFNNETASGWQDATFSSPVHVTAGTTYVVSYFAPNGHYDGSSHYWQVPHATNDYVSGLQDGADGSNGVYAGTGSTTFPTSTFNAANYWVDVDFQPSAPGTFVTARACASAPSYPDGSCTGSLGGDTMANLTGSVVLDNNNQTYTNLKIGGTLIVRGCGDTLRNIEVDAGEPFTGNATTPDLFAIWLQVPSNCTTTIDRVSVITQPAPNNYATTGIRVANGGPITVTNTQVTGVQIGILAGTGTLQDNYVTLGATQRGDHNENILSDTASNFTLNHNTFLNSNSQTAAIALFTENGSNSNVLVENNLLAGGGYTVYAGDGKTNGTGGAIGPPTNVSFVNNVFWRKYYPDAGFFAYGRDYNPNGGGQWTGNLYMDAAGNMTNEVVPQPAPAS